MSEPAREYSTRKLDGQRRVRPMSVAKRQEVKEFASKHVQTPEFQKKLASARARMEAEANSDG